MSIDTSVMNFRRGRAGADLCLLHCPFPPRMEIHDKDLYLGVPCLGQSLAHSICSVNISRMNENIQHKKIQIIKILQKEMATHSSTLSWRIPGTEEPGGLPSMGSHRVGHD